MPYHSGVDNVDQHERNIFLFRCSNRVSNDRRGSFRKVHSSDKGTGWVHGRYGLIMRLALQASSNPPDTVSGSALLIISSDLGHDRRRNVAKKPKQSGVSRN